MFIIETGKIFYGKNIYQNQTILASMMLVRHDVGDDPDSFTSSGLSVSMGSDDGLTSVASPPLPSSPECFSAAGGGGGV